MDDLKFDVWALSHGNDLGFFFPQKNATHYLGRNIGGIIFTCGMPHIELHGFD